MKRLLAAGALILAIAGAAPMVLAQSTGTLTENGVSMPVKAAVAVLDGQKLTVHVLPFVPTAEETARFQADDSMWLLGRSSPDPAKWKTSPWGRVRVSWFEPADVGDPKKASVYVYTFGVGAEQSNLNTTKDGKDVALTLTGPLKEGQEVTLTTKGSDTFSKATLSWDLSVKTKVLRSTRKP